MAFYHWLKENKKHTVEQVDKLTIEEYKHFLFSLPASKYGKYKRAVRKACLEVIPESIAQQAIVPVPMEVMAPDGNPSIPDNSKETSALELEINGVTIRITEETSTALLAKVLGVVAHVK